MNTALIYCRVSTKEQVENFSLPEQERQCREYCKRHGYEVSQTFVEQGESAKTADRTELGKLLSLCSKKRQQIDYLVVHKLDRLARNAGDFHGILRQLNRAGTLIRSVDESIDETASGKLMAGIHAVLAEYDNNVRSERTVVGMKAALRQGRWTFQPPLGYRKPMDQRGPSLESDPVQGPLVTMAFKKMSSGRYSQREVLRQLTAAGLRSKRTGQPVGPQTFRRLLRNPLYKGWIATRMEEPVRGDFEALVPEQTFDAVQAEMKGRRGERETPYRLDNPDFPLRRFVRCGVCGRSLTGSRSKGRKLHYSYYHCPAGCDGMRSQRERLESAFSDLLHGLRCDSNVLNLFRAVVEDVWEESQKDTEKTKRRLEKQLRDIQHRKDNLVDAAVHQGLIDATTYREQSERLEETRQDVATELRSLNKKLDVTTTMNFAEGVLADPSAFWKGAQPALRRRFQVAVYPNGLVFDGEKFRTVVTSPVFRHLQGFQEAEGRMASPTGFEPVSPA